MQNPHYYVVEESVFGFKLKSIKSFDLLLLAILVMAGLSQFRGGLDVGILFYIGLLAGCLILTRWMVKAKTIRGALTWFKGRSYIAFLVAFVWLGNLMYVGLALWDGHLTAASAISVYLLASVLFSTVILAGGVTLNWLFGLLASTKNKK